MIYLDNAATTIKKPDAVYDAVLDAMKHCGNSGRGMADASLDASRKIYYHVEMVGDLLDELESNGLYF